MKELSVEQKAKAYDNLIERLKDLKFAYRFSTLSDTIEEKFPELKESEDEKIRKEIISAVNIYCSEYCRGAKVREDMLAWLEKQEQHKKFRDSIQVGDKVTRNENGVLVNLSKLNRVAKKDEKQCEQKPEWTPMDEQRVENLLAIIEGHGYPGEVAWLNSLKDRVQPKQGEQKPADKVEPKFKIGDTITDPTDSTFTFHINAIKDGKYMESDKDWVLIKEADSDYELVEQKSAWSEEDEKMRAAVLQLITDSEKENGWNCVYCNDKEIYFSDIIDWIKSLKERYTWKPSDEQMEALSNALSLAKNCGEENAFDLNTLYEQLKKLREE